MTPQTLQERLMEMQLLDLKSKAIHEILDFDTELSDKDKEEYYQDLVNTRHKMLQIARKK